MPEQDYKEIKNHPKNIDDICFQYAFVTTQAYKEIKNRPEQVLNIKHFLIYSIGWVPNIQQPEIKIIILYFKKITPKLL